MTGVLDCDEVADTDGTLNDICCRVSGRFPCLLGGTNGDVSDVVGDKSSNRSRTITLGSDLVLLLDSDPDLACCRPLSCPLVVEPSPAMAYSGRSAKLFGVTTTLYVPGNVVSALRSRSSSFVRVAKAGRFRPESELIGLSGLTVAAL